MTKRDKNRKAVRIIRVAVIACANVTLLKRFFFTFA